MAFRVAVDARLFEYQPAGIATYTRNLLAEMPRLTDEFEFVALRSRLKPVPLPPQPRLRERRLVTPPHNRWEQVALPLEVALSRPHLLHSPDFIPCFHRYWRAVVTVHDLAFLRYPDLLTMESRRYYGQVAQACQSAERIIAVSHNTAKDLRDLLGAPPERVKVVHEGAGDGFAPLDRQQARQAVADRFGVAGPFVLFVSTIEPRKNLETLLRAWAELHKREATAPARGKPCLLVVGRPGWLHEKIYGLVDELGIEGSVRFGGPATTDELVALYNGALALAYPSLYEGFGLPPLEAMACGLPVLCADTSSLPEVVGDAGLLLPPLDVGAWAQALHRVALDASLRAELSGRGLARARLFSWRRAAVETLAVYREALGLASQS
jgi:glycosyltransferase involved in cell wall biosynthesis